MERYTELHGGIAVIKKNKTKEAAERLSAYEDTELTPEQIQELKERDTAKTVQEVDEELGYFVCPHCREGICTGEDFWMEENDSGNNNMIYECALRLRGVFC